MKCIQCGIEFEAKRSTARYCSGACRLKHKRGEVSVSSDEVSVTKDSVTGLSVSSPVVFKNPAKYQLTKAQLDNLPAGVTKPGTGPPWAHENTYYKTIHRLVTWSLDRLKKHNIWIPAWRHLQG